ncbi:hypothetical protein CWI80_08400 [Pseudidiomarina sediminum]|uniref:Uncharacterized protein n=1 Tax=Pseudidiomarina sediminum TaxID=431675 RepID=A0A432Z3W1_9GAMM|nr:hypothetical protein [Pseudidiomarina sediminum]MBY6062756.1 hypothetical protein [Pseudidiomarina sediminum]RUO72561.1 hypothetical protein CWI80_08400 [Pseudidiomarina sediminum]
MEQHNYRNAEPVSLGDWMLTLFLTFIPLVNLIALLVWSFSSSTAPSKQNWARATLLWMIIGIAIVFVITLLGVGSAVMLGSQYN